MATELRFLGKYLASPPLASGTTSSNLPSTEVALDECRMTADSLRKPRIRPVPCVWGGVILEVMVEPIPCLGHNVEVPRAGSRAGEVALDHGHRGVDDVRRAEGEGST